MLVVAALHASNRTDDFKSEIESADKYIDSMGRIEGLKKRYGKDKTFAVPILANCAMAGIVPWNKVSALPFEAACVPQKFYNLMQLPVVSYAIPALVAIGQAKFILDPPWDPFRRLIRKLSIKRSLKVLDRMQPASGGFLEATPLTSFVVMALVKSGRADHPVVKNGLRFILASFRDESASATGGEGSCTKTQIPSSRFGDSHGFESPRTGAIAQTAGSGKKPSANARTSLGRRRPDTGANKFSNDETDHETSTPLGSWPIDTDLALWNTTLSINAISNYEPEFNQNIEQWDNCVAWILDNQNTDVHPFTGAEPGGWGWTHHSGAVPDADDTPGAILALNQIREGLAIETQQKINSACEAGKTWLLNLQNRDKGWPTFCRGWGKLPFDRSGSDITAHVIRGLVCLNDQTRKTQAAIKSGFKYLRANQQKDGSWFPLWFGNQDIPDEVNPCYGTAKVLLAYRDAKAFDTNEAQIGLRWIRENQNKDGGWGGGKSLRWPDDRLGSSSVEETALCTEVLLEDTSNPESQAAAQLGVDWLIQAVKSGCVDESWPIGFYFAKLWYFEKMYPLIFATSALGRAMQLKHESNQ